MFSAIQHVSCTVNVGVLVPLARIDESDVGST